MFMNIVTKKSQLTTLRTRCTSANNSLFHFIVIWYFLRFVISIVNIFLYLTLRIILNKALIFLTVKVIYACACVCL